MAQYSELNLDNHLFVTLIIPCLNIALQHYGFSAQLVGFRPFQILHLAQSHPSMQIRIATGLLYLVPVGRAPAGPLVQYRLLCVQRILP